MRGGGTLYVNDHYLALKPSRPMKLFGRPFVGELRTIVHSKPYVVLVLGRLLPFWLNTSLVIEGDDETAVASVPGWDRRALRRLVEDAGFSVRVERTLISMGTSYVRYP